MSPYHSAMRPLTVAAMVRRNLWRQPLRSGLTILGVAVGVVGIVSLSAIVAGIRQSIESGIHVAGSDLLVYQAGVAADILSSLDEAETRAALRRDPDVADVAAGMSHIMPVEGQRFTIILGVEGNSFTYDAANATGPPISADDEISLGVVAAKTFGKNVGDRMTLSDREFRVISVFKTGVIIYDAAVVVHLPALQKMLGREGRVTAFFVDLKLGADAAAAAKRLEAANPEIVAIGGASEYHRVDIGLQTAEAMIWAVTLAAMVIGGVVVLNTMWMTVLERTREIGVLRATGWSRRRVIGAVLIEALTVALLAIPLGSGLGVGLALAIGFVPHVGQLARPSFSAGMFLLAGGAAISLSLLGGLLPAWRAARISPAEALRYE
jgi:putative ABC transport system permease protein